MKGEVNELEMNKGNMKTQGLVEKEGNVKEEDTEDDENKTKVTCANLLKFCL